MDNQIPLSPKGQAALGYVEQGWFVFPVAGGTKNVLLAGGWKDVASNNPDEIRKWWAQHPDANIGLNLIKSGLVAVDADTYKPKCEFYSFVSGLTEPDTMTQRSARGGLHYLFEATPDDEFPGKLCEGVEIKRNGYIMLAPSNFGDGTYTIVNTSKPARCPDWVPRKAPTEAQGAPTHTRAETVSDDELSRLVKQKYPYAFYIAGEPWKNDGKDGGQYDWSDRFVFVLKCLCEFSSNEDQIKRAVMGSAMVTQSDAKGRVSRVQKAKRLWTKEYRAAREAGDRARSEWKCRGLDSVRIDLSSQIRRAMEQDGEPTFDMAFVTGKERAVQMEHLIDPWLAKRNVIGLFGRGEVGKSSWASFLCALASDQVSTLWISSEEDTNHVALRYTHSGGQPNTLITLPATPVKYDKHTGKAVATNFNVYSHLENAIADFRKVPGYRHDRPLGIVVLDAINALVTWGKGENANDDASVKRLLAYLHSLAMNYDLSIFILGHMNKHTSKEHGADAVTGSAAWTNSLRKAFVFYKDLASDDYEGFIRTAKGNTGTAFAASYKTVPVYTLLKRANGMDEVLCRVELTSDIVWGERNIAKLLNDSDDEDPVYDKRNKRKERLKMYATHVAKAVREGAATRDAINAAIPKEVGTIYPKYWAKVDALLKESFGVDVTTVSHGKYEYKASLENTTRAAIPKRTPTL